MVFTQYEEVEPEPGLQGWKKFQCKKDNRILKTHARYEDPQGTEFTYEEVKELLAATTKVKKDVKKKGVLGSTRGKTVSPKKTFVEPRSSAGAEIKCEECMIMFTNSKEKVLHMEKVHKKKKNVIVNQRFENSNNTSVNNRERALDKSKKNESNINVLNKEQYNNLVKKNDGARFKNDSLSSRMTNTPNLSRLGGNLIVSQEKIPVNKLRQEKPAVVKITKTKPEHPIKMQKQERKVSITSVPKINKSHPPGPNINMKNVKIHQYDDDEYEDDDCVELYDTPNVVELDQEDEEIEVLEETTDRSGDLGLDINCLNISPSIEITRTMADKQTTKKTVSYGQFGDEEEDYGENNEDYSDDEEGSDYDMDQEVQAPVEITLDSEPEEITLDGGEDDLDYDEHMDTAEEIEDRELEKLKEVDARLSNSDYVLQMVEDEDHGPEMLADFTAHSWFAQPKGWRPSSTGEVWSATVDQVKKHYRLVEVVIQEQFNDQEEFLTTVIPRLELDNNGRSKVGLYRLAKAMWFKSLDPEIPVMTETLEDDEIYEENGEEEYDEYDEYDEPDDGYNENEDFEVEENYEEYENVAESAAGEYFQEYEDPAEDEQEEEGEFIDYGNNYDEQVEYTDYYEDGI